MADRIVVEVAPRVSPRRVMELYSRERGRMLRGWGRALSEKHAELAVFAAGANPSEGWDHAMREWNKVHPRWRCKDVRIFTRDAHHAYRRVTGQPLQWRQRRIPIASDRKREFRDLRVKLADDLIAPEGK